MPREAWLRSGDRIRGLGSLSVEVASGALGERGQMTEQMQVLYSTVNGVEQEWSIGKVIDLMQVRAQRTGGAPNAASGAPKAGAESVQTDVQKDASGAPGGAPTC